MSLSSEIPQRIIFRRYPALLQAILLVVGLLCDYRYHPFYPSISLLAGAIVLFLLSYIRPLIGQRVTPFLRHIALGCTTFSLGLILAQADYNSLETSPLPKGEVCALAQSNAHETSRGYWRVEVLPMGAGVERKILVYLPPSPKALPYFLRRYAVPKSRRSICFVIYPHRGGQTPLVSALSYSSRILCHTLSSRLPSSTSQGAYGAKRMGRRPAQNSCQRL